MGCNGQHSSTRSFVPIPASSRHCLSMPATMPHPGVRWSVWLVYHSQIGRWDLLNTSVIATMSQVIFCKVLWFVLKKYSLKSLEVTCVPAGLGSLGMKLAQWPRSSPTSRGMQQDCANINATHRRASCAKLRAQSFLAWQEGSKSFPGNTNCRLWGSFWGIPEHIQRKCTNMDTFVRQQQSMKPAMTPQSTWQWMEEVDGFAWETSTTNVTNFRIFASKLFQIFQFSPILGPVPVENPSAQLGIQAPMPQSLWAETTGTTEAKRPHHGSPTSQLHLRTGAIWCFCADEIHILLGKNQENLCLGHCCDFHHYIALHWIHLHVWWSILAFLRFHHNFGMKPLDNVMDTFPASRLCSRQ